MQLDEAAHQRESDAEAALRAVTPPFLLVEQIENPRQCYRHDAHPRIADRNYGIPVLLGNADPDIAIGRGMGNRIADEVGQDLLDAGSVAAYPDRHDVDIETMARGLACRAQCFSGAR